MISLVRLSTIVCLVWMLVVLVGSILKLLRLMLRR